MFAKTIEKAHASFGEKWLEEFSEDLQTMFGDTDGMGWDEAIKGYALFSLDALLNQKRYEASGHYQASNYAEVKRDYWDNPDFMLQNYMPGICGLITIAYSSITKQSSFPYCNRLTIYLNFAKLVLEPVSTPEQPCVDFHR
jgi:hypothetical protein